jgi:hypothetical protein
MIPKLLSIVKIKMWQYMIPFLFLFFHLILKLNHLNSEIYCGKKFRYI